MAQSTAQCAVVVKPVLKLETLRKTCQAVEIATEGKNVIKLCKLTMEASCARLHEVNPKSAVAQVVSKARSDLVPKVYEGGFKVWDCSLDLVGWLHKTQLPQKLKSQRVVELGCGQGLPGVYCMQAGMEVVFQDYNAEVLHHATGPNALLNAPNPLCTPTFVAGDWSSASMLALLGGKHSAALVLTAETIYNKEALPSLVNLLAELLTEEGCALVAAKRYYFGVGQGTSGTFDFVEFLKQDGRLQASTVHIVQSGFSNIREVLQVTRRKQKD